MKLLLDENLPVVLVKDFLPEHEAVTVKWMGWSGKVNGDLLSSMRSANIDFLVTVDRNLQHQLPLERYGIYLILLRVVHNKLPLLVPLIPMVKTYLHGGEFDRVKVIEADGR